MSNANYELPPTDEVTIDGYKIDLSGGVLAGQTLVYDAGNNTFIAGDAYGTVSGSFVAQQVAYGTGTFTLAGSNNFIFNDSSNTLSVFGDGYFSKRLIINGSSASVSASGTGAFRFNSGTNHLEFSENGGGWTQVGSGTLAIGAAVTSGTNKSVLFIDSSVHLAQDNSNFNYDSSTKKLTVAGHVSVDGYTIDISAGAVTNQVLTYNGTSFVAQNSTGGISGTLTSTKVPYATGSSTLADSGMAWDNTSKILTITTLAGNDGVAVTDGTRSLGLFVNYNGAAVGALGTTSNHNLVFFTNNQAAQMTLSTSGNLGIGVSPSYKLDVNGTANFAGDITPASNNAYSLGTSSAKFKDGYFAGKISLDGYTIDLSAGGTNGQALVYDTGTGTVHFSTVSGGGGGVGTSGQKFINIIPMGFVSTNNTGTAQTVAGVQVDPTNFTLNGTTQSVVFRATAALGNTSIDGYVQLYNVTDSSQVTLTHFTSGSVADTTIDTTVTGSISGSAKTYEVRIYANNPTGPTDYITLLSAQLRIINTIN